MLLRPSSNFLRSADLYLSGSLSGSMVKGVDLDIHSVYNMTIDIKGFYPIIIRN